MASRSRHLGPYGEHQHISALTPRGTLLCTPKVRPASATLSNLSDPRQTTLRHAPRSGYRTPVVERFIDGAAPARVCIEHIDRGREHVGDVNSGRGAHGIETLVAQIFQPPSSGGLALFWCGMILGSKQCLGRELSVSRVAPFKCFRQPGSANRESRR